ncbi:MAG: SH3 domain-containing protein [Bacteroidota bacterium]
MNYSNGDTLSVVAINGLSVRSTPGTEGDRITILENSERVTIKDTSNSKNQADSIFGFLGSWVLIETKDKILGYVFDAF